MTEVCVCVCAHNATVVVFRWHSVTSSVEAAVLHHCRLSAVITHTEVPVCVCVCEADTDIAGVNV